MSHLQVYYPECSQNEKIRIKEELRKENKKLIEANEILQEHKLLVCIDFLPIELQRLIGDFSTVVAEQRVLVRFEFFDRWVIENTSYIMGLLDSWTKPQVGFVLNSIVQLREPEFVGYLKGNRCYQEYNAKYLRKQIKFYISRRTQKIRPDFKDVPRYRWGEAEQRFVPCQVNPSFDECPQIRVYGAYKAIEEYNTRLKIKKGEPKK